MSDYLQLCLCNSPSKNTGVGCHALLQGIFLSQGLNLSPALQADSLPWTAACPWGLEESDMTERLHFHFSLSCIGEGNGNPLQCSCLENPIKWVLWELQGVNQLRMASTGRLPGEGDTWAVS